MKTKPLIAACLAASTLGLLAPPASAAPPVPPSLGSVEFVWHGLGTDGMCHSTLTVTLDQGFTKGRPVRLYRAWVTSEGRVDTEGFYKALEPGQTSWTEEMAYRPQGYAYAGLVFSLRYAGAKLVEEPMKVMFPDGPYYCL